MKPINFHAFTYIWSENNIKKKVVHFSIIFMCVEEGGGEGVLGGALRHPITITITITIIGSSEIKEIKEERKTKNRIL